MKFSDKNLIRLAFLIVLFYLFSYCYLIVSKGGVYGSDVLTITNMVKNLETSGPVISMGGFPIGFLIILQMESKILNADVLNFAPLHISLLFTVIFALVSIFAFVETKNKLVSILAGFITISVCPFASIMSPQYLQEVTLAAIVLLPGLIFLSKYEKSERRSFLITGLFLALFTIFIHRSTLVITFVTLFFWMIILSIKQKRVMTTFLIIIPFLAIFVLLVVGIYGEYINQPLFVSNKKILGDYASTYFMNYIGWELVPFLIVAVAFLKDILKRFSTIFLSFAAACILFSGIYLTGYSLVSTTIAWRATYYMLFISSIITSYVIYILIKRERSSLLFGISSISFLLFILDEPIQKYIYRAVSGTTPERISIPIPFGNLAPYIILGVMGILLLLSLLYYKKLEHPMARKSFVILFIIVLILVPRGLMSMTSFYLMPQNLRVEEEQLLIYLDRKWSDESVFSDPQTTHIINNYGLKTWVPITPFYGPTKEGPGVAWWAVWTDKIFKGYTAEQTYEFARNRKISLVVVNKESGRLINYAANDGKGGYILAPNTIETFNNRIGSSDHFTKLFECQTEKGDVSVYKIGGVYK